MTARFLDTLFGGSKGYIGISHKGPGFKTSWHESRADAASAVDDTAEAVYVRMTTVREIPDEGRGTAQDSWYLPGLWSDLDFGSDGHSSPNLPADEVEAESVVALSGLPKPSVLIHSGGGLYALWLLADPLELTDENRADVARLSSDWQAQLAAGSATQGWSYDSSVKDLARVLRLPGTYNRKKTDEDRLCRVLWDNGPRYTYAGLRSALDDAQMVVEPPPPRVPAVRDSWDLAKPPTNAEVARAAELLDWYADHIRHGTVPMSGGGVAPGRNVGANTALFLLYGFVNGGCIDKDVVTETIWEATLDAPGPLGPGEWDREQFDSVVESAWGSAVPQRPDTTDLAQIFSDIGHEILDATPTLRHIRDEADSNGRGGMGMLCFTLARVLAEVPPEYVLPGGRDGAVGSRASLNLGFAFVGHPGAGKSDLAKNSQELLGIDQSDIQRMPASGQGLIASYVTWSSTARKNVLVSDPRRLFNVDEIGQFGVYKDSDGSVLGENIKTMLTGGHVGTETADATRNRNLPSNSYRMVLTAGVQPAKSAVLLRDEDSGLPQRFVWVWVADEDISPPDERPESPGELGWSADWLAFTGSEYVIDYPDHIKREIRMVDWEKSRKTDAEEARAWQQRAHLNLSRLKVAAALALLHREIKITDRWWELAGKIVDASMAVVDECKRELAGQARAKRAAEAVARDRTDDAVEDDRVERCAAYVLRKVKKAGGQWVSVTDARPSVKLREYLDDAIDFLMSGEKGFELEEYTSVKGNPSRRIRWVESG